MFHANVDEKESSLSELLIPIEQLLSDFNENKSWDKQYRLIIQLGKKLPALDACEKIEANQVQGCESLAWCVAELSAGKMHFRFDSDTRVVKGLMMILLIIFENKSPAQIAALDINALFAQLGLLTHLSPSRANGLLAIVDKIKTAGKE